MARGAVRMARAVGYEGAGTIEYLYADGEYYFLELNPRLQVEHPVTESISGVNLPAAQLNIAMGIALHRIPEIRRLYGFEPYGTDKFDLYSSPQIAPRGHCIAVRITAENPDLGFKPTSGKIQELTFRTSPNVWGYFSVVAQGSLHDFADSQVCINALHLPQSNPIQSNPPHHYQSFVGTNCIATIHGCCLEHNY
jgi:acetyl-CoA carboxylase / biotin carboxylase 1